MLGQRPELLDFAATFGESVLAFVSNERQTAIVTGGASIRLDWLRWVDEVVGDSADNATFTVTKTQLDVSGDPIGAGEVLQPSGPAERITVAVDPDTNEYYVTIRRVVAVEGAEDPDRAIYDLEACLPQPDGTIECYSSNITVYALEPTVDPLGIYIPRLYHNNYNNHQF